MSAAMDVQAALALILAHSPQLAVERAPLAQARGRVVAAAVEAPRDLPPFDNSAMDGFALRWQAGLQAGSELDVVAEQAAGDGRARQQDDACSIMTGARLPDGLDTVVPVENCSVLSRDAEGAPHRIVLNSTPVQGAHVRRAGEDVAAGAQVLAAGTVLSDEALMVLRGIGLADVNVHRRPRVALAITGRELVDTDGAALAPGQIANTNGPYLQSLFERLGAEVVERVSVPDEPERLLQPMRRWLDDGIDLIATTGAVSMGRYDFVPEVLRQLGAQIHFHKLTLRPGKPLLFARAARSLIFGLPGNPISGTVGTRFFAYAAMRRMTGQATERPWMLPLLHEAHKKPGFTLIQKAALGLDVDGRLGVRLLAGQESFKTAPMLKANAWAILPPQAERLQVGERVAVHSLYPDCAVLMDDDDGH